MMTFTELLKNRRAIRDFQAKEVSLDTVKEILQDATMAPSASHGQPCQFIIINNLKFYTHLQRFLQFPVMEHLNNSSQATKRLQNTGLLKVIK